MRFAALCNERTRVRIATRRLQEHKSGTSTRMKMSSTMITVLLGRKRPTRSYVSEGNCSDQYMTRICPTCHEIDHFAYSIIRTTIASIWKRGPMWLVSKRVLRRHEQFLLCFIYHEHGLCIPLNRALDYLSRMKCSTPAGFLNQLSNNIQLQYGHENDLHGHHEI